MITIKEIADRLGVSVSTVSKGINGASDISESLRQKVLDTAIEMGYTSKKMKKEEHKKLCLFIENMDYHTPDEFGYDIVLGFKQAALRENWQITIVPVTPEFQLQEKYDTYMLKNGYSGSFMVGFALQDDWIRQLETSSIPAVLFDNFIPKNPNIGYIGVDNNEGIDLAVEYLHNLGHRRIAFLNGSLHSLVTEQREQAYLDSMTKYGLETNDKLLAHGFFIADSAKYHVEDFLKEGASAIICGNDLIASGVFAECTRLGYSIPDDVSVIGFDDLPVSSFLDPPLTTIQQNRIELGKCGFVVLNSLIHHVSISRTLMRPLLISRASTAPFHDNAK